MVPEPVAVAFANTHSSVARDRITTMASWRTWIEGWPRLRSTGRKVDSEGLVELRLLRNDVQLDLRASAAGQEVDGMQITRLQQFARSTPDPVLRWPAGRRALVLPPGVKPATTIAQHLARAALDLLVTGPPLAACEGRDCLKVFVATRADRRWCDGAIWGNRARVAAHNRRPGRMGPAAHRRT